MERSKIMFHRRRIRLLRGTSTEGSCEEALWFTGSPTELNVEKSKEKEVTDSEEDEEEKKDEEGKDCDEAKIEEVAEEEEKEEKKKKAKKAKEVSHEWGQFNKNKLLWMRNSEEVTNEEHASFHRSLSNDWALVSEAFQRGRPP